MKIWLMMVNADVVQSEAGRYFIYQYRQNFINPLLNQLMIIQDQKI